MTLFKGQPPDNQLVIGDERVLRIEDGKRRPRRGPGSTRWEIIGRAGQARRTPWAPGPRTVGGWDLALVDYAPALEASFEPQGACRLANDGVGPAQRWRVRLVSKRLKSVGRTMAVGRPDRRPRGASTSGWASVQVRARHGPPAVESAAKPRRRSRRLPRPRPGKRWTKRIIAFALRPDDAVRQTAPGTALRPARGCA